MRQEEAILEVIQYRVLMQGDDSLVALRGAVRRSALDRLAKGAIPEHDYLAQALAEDRALLNRRLHRIRWLYAQYRYQSLIGH